MRRLIRRFREGNTRQRLIKTVKELESFGGGYKRYGGRCEEERKDRTRGSRDREISQQLSGLAETEMQEKLWEDRQTPEWTCRNTK